MGSGASAGKHWKTFGLNSLDQRVVLCKEDQQKSRALQQLWGKVKQRRQGREEGHAEDDGPAKTGVNVKNTAQPKGLLQGTNSCVVLCQPPDRETCPVFPAALLQQQMQRLASDFLQGEFENFEGNKNTSHTWMENHSLPSLGRSSPCVSGSRPGCLGSLLVQALLTRWKC